MKLSLELPNGKHTEYKINQLSPLPIIYLLPRNIWKPKHLLNYSLPEVRCLDYAKRIVYLNSDSIQRLQSLCPHPTICTGSFNVK